MSSSTPAKPGINESEMSSRMNLICLLYITIYYYIISFYAIIMGRVLCGNIVCPALRAFVAHARSLRSFWNCTTTAPFQQSGKSSNPDSSYRSGWQLHSASGRALHLKLLPWPSTQVHSSLSKLGCQRANQILILKCLILKSTDWSSKSCRQQPKANKEALQSGMEEKATKHNKT